MKKCYVIIGRGDIPTDFPRKELGEYFSLKAKIIGGEILSKEESDRFEELNESLRKWKRNNRNDEYWEGFFDVISHIMRNAGTSVYFGFYDYCSPSITEAIDRAVKNGCKRIIVAPVMIIPGDRVCEIEIKERLEFSKILHPEAEIIYAWPYPEEEIADFIIKQIERFDNDK